MLLVHYFGDECLGRLESGNIVRRNDHGGLLGDIAGGFLSPVLGDEAAETTEVNRLTLDYGILDAIHGGLNDAHHYGALEACCFCNFLYDVSFSHFR